MIIKFNHLNLFYLQTVQCLLGVYRFKLGADSVTFNQDYVDPNLQEAPEAPPTYE